MDIAVAGAIIIVPLILIAVALGIVALVRSTRTRSADAGLQRAGASGAADPSDAALRATGTSAWMRPGGGGI